MDIIWLAIYNYYARKGDNMPIFSSNMVLAAALSCNILSIVFPLNFKFPDIIVLNKIIVLLIAFVVVCFVLLRYNKKKLAQLEISKEGSSTYRILVLIYILLSLGSMFAIAGYIGYMRKNHLT